MTTSIHLQFAKSTPTDAALQRSAADHYDIVETVDGAPFQRVGSIRLRLDRDEDTLLYAGQMGYDIDAAYRGCGYAVLACQALKPIAISKGFHEIIITCNTDNSASRRVCEKLSATLLEIIDLPATSDMYQLKGERQKCRYRWTLHESGT